MKTSALILLTALLLAACGSEERPTAQHLLIISVDTLRVDRLGCYGGRPNVSPAIDRLAQEGVRFETAFSTASSTLPAVTTVMTGKYPSEHGVLANRYFPIPDSEDFLAEKLGEAGFSRGAFVANQLLAAPSGVGQGFETHETYSPHASQLTMDAEQDMTSDAARWMREHFKDDGRAFLWVHYMQPHAPYDPPKYGPELTDPGYRGGIDGSRETLNRVYVEKQQLSPADLDHVLGLYDASVRYVDDLIDRLLVELRGTGQLESTLVVFVADHGEDLYDHNAYFYHANSVYRSSLQVPLIFSWPGTVEPGRVAPELVSSVDIRQTILSMLGVGRDAGGDGHDLSPLIRGEASTPRELAFSQFEEDIFTVFSDRWTFVDNVSEVTPRHIPTEGEYPVARRELYDRSTDRDEQTDISSDQAKLVERFENSIAEWRSQLRKPGEAVSDRRSLSELEQLRRLGYTGKGSRPKSSPKDDEDD
ncbi:MAG: sulfatase [Planctomycetota bacterium]